MTNDKYEYIEYEKLSDAVRDWENGEKIYHYSNIMKSWLLMSDYHIYIGRTFAKRALKPESRYETLYRKTGTLDGGTVYTPVEIEL